MATERLVIEVSEKGALVVKRNIDSIGKSADGTDGALKLLKGALATAASAAVIKQYIDLADTFTNLQNRLRIVTGGEAELAKVTDELFQISEDTRSSFESTAELYARVALASKDLGVSQAETLAFTKSLNQAVILSGASATEAQAGIIQLSQGLASGSLRGDELRSVLEQLPVVADVIAKSMGVTRGELREMGAEGKITAKIVLDAFKQASDGLDSDFGTTVPTVGQSLTVLRNEILRTVAEFDTGTGATRELSKLILELAANLDIVTEVAQTTGDIVVALFNNLRELVQPLITEVEGLGITWSDVWENIKIGTLAVLLTVAQVVDKTIGLFLGLANAVIAAMEDIPGSVASIFTRGFNVWVSIVEAGINKIVDGMNKVGEALGLDPLEQVDLGRLEDPAQEAGDRVAEAFMLGFNQTAIQDLLNNVIDDVAVAGAEREFRKDQRTREGEQVDLTTKTEGAGVKADTGYADYLAGLERENELLKYTNEQRVIEIAYDKARKDLKRELTDVEKDQIALLTEQGTRLAEVTAATQETDLSQKEYNTAVATLNDLLAEGVLNQDQFKAKLTELNDALEGQANGFEALADVGASVFDNMFSALDEAVQGGKVTFKDFTNSVLSDIARIAAQQVLLQGLQSLGIPLPGFATGGSFKVGGQGGTDSQLVSFMATPDERVDVLTPAQQRQEQAATAVAAAPSIKIVNVTDPNEVPQAMSSSEGEQVIVNTLLRNPEALKQAVSS